MKFKDPKFGYHWLWMLPIACAAEFFLKICDICKHIYHHIHIKRILKKNPDINKLSKLSGIKK